jgi:hypothetical protein
VVAAVTTCFFFANSDMSPYRDHPILPQASSYQLVEFCHHGFAWTPNDHYIVLVLKKDDEVVRLRFDRPRQLEINDSFPTQFGLFISDISSDGLEDINIKVGDYENSSIRFFAKSVEIL